MMKKQALTLAALLTLSPFAMAHTALLSCFDEGDQTITCEGGFSDGSSASGVKFLVVQAGKNIVETKFNELNSVNFSKPEGDYEAIFDAGDGHNIVIKSSNIN
ncbi:hypothetical protein B9T11_02115 [Wohlfahrtiimonas chitiniclastica]|nr:hypothetical protein B9T13_00630 [Wohlfahrtiimonas chitiniclastica]OYQ83075.1 hypothetical protein B9T11_02115 [Wohlfahrtiimonas chitiniclastica]OYQ85859.1 hypothetical protein B9T14_00630 [Wohlfahrtiimonas chitiniclastica]OYQ86879.1 hypothetical protein B9T15_04410 [Wohlfahrtiimonas chitiniclastica]